jgi:hypothetical protein
MSWTHAPHLQHVLYGGAAPVCEVACAELLRRLQDVQQVVGHPAALRQRQLVVPGRQVCQGRYRQSGGGGGVAGSCGLKK